MVLGQERAMNRLFILALALVSGTGAAEPSLSTVKQREKKQFGAFAIVQFKNEECQATSTTSMQGVCYSSSECSDKGGTKDGNCAAGFGVCCTFTVDDTSTGTVNNNITYLQNNGYPSAITTASQTVTYTINACSNDICFLRYDFVENTLPITSATGACIGAFTVTSPSGSNPPAICGNNANYHMYSDVGKSTSATTVVITTGTGTTSRTWKIKVSQIECTNPNKPPSGCTQYYTTSSGTIESYNFNGGQLSTVLNYAICFRANQGTCGMSYSVDSGTTTPDPFCLPTATAPDQTGTATAPCTTNGSARSHSCTLAKIQISGVGSAGSGEYCGTELNNINAAVGSGTIVTTGTPYQVNVITVATDLKTSNGFKLNYSQRSNCN